MRTLSLILCLMVLTGCVSREQADAKLVKGCNAAVNYFLKDGFQVKEIKSTNFESTSTFGPGYRAVRLGALESDGFFELDKEYFCVFAEEFGMFNMSHSAALYQVKVEGDVFGQTDEGDIKGSMKDFMKLKEVVSNAMEKSK